MTDSAEGADRQPSDSTASEPIGELLWEFFPEQREMILAFEEEEREFAEEAQLPLHEVGAYTLISDVFVSQILSPLFAAPRVDEALAQRCSRFLERLLELGDQDSFIKEMISIRITDHLLGYQENWVKFHSYAGKLLLREVGERQIYYTGPFLI